MTKILLYLIQSILASGILYGYYHFFLRNKKFHQYNRFYLLAAVAISIIVPFLNIPVYFSGDADESAIVFKTLQDISIKSARETPYSLSNDFFATAPWVRLLGTFYACVVFICIVRILSSLYKINAIINKNSVEELDGIKFINTDEPGTPFSFFRWLFWNNKIPLRSDNGQQIFRHELYHIEQNHSIDVLFMEILLIFGWFNPFFHLIKKELRAIHEFLADRFAIREIQNWEYAELLLKQALDTQTNLVNPFFHNQIKRRIAMITSSNKTTHQYLRKLMVLPVATIAIALFAFNYRNTDEKKSVDISPNSFALEKNFDTIPVKPAGSDSTTKRGTQIAEELASPSVDKIVVGKKFETSVPGEQKIGLKIYEPKLDNVLIVLDGKVLPLGSADEQMKRLDPNKIESINVLKDKTAIDKYGATGTNGVIEINSKSGNMEIQEVIIPDGKVSPANEIVVQGYARPKTVEGEVKEVTLNHVNTDSKYEVVVDGFRTKPDNKIKEVTLKPVKKDNEIVVQGYKTEKKIGTGVTEVRIVEGKPTSDNKIGVQDTKRQDIIFEKTEVEAEFPGGIDGWRTYLIKNLNANVPVDKGAPPGKYTVVAQFIVNQDGTLSDVKAITNNGYGMEGEVLRLMQNGPTWKPAIQNGHSVKAYRRQPVTFLVEEVIGAMDDKIYPNPATQTAVLKIVVEEAGESQVSIADVNGRVVNTSKRTFQKGSNTLTLSTNALNKGLYTISVSVPGKSKQVRFYKLLKD